MASKREMGWQAFQQGDIRGAITLLESACEENPGDYEAHLYLGAAYGKAGQKNDAVTIITKAVQIQPSNPQARYNLGVALENAGFAPQAMEAIQQAVVLDPNYLKAKEALQRLQQQEKLRRLQPENAALPHSAAPSGSASAPIVNSPSSDDGFAPNSQAIAQTPAEHSAAPFPTSNFVTPEDVPHWDAPAQPASGFDAPTASAPGYEPPGVSQKTAALPSYGLLSDYSPSPHSPSGPTAIPDTYPTVLPPPNYHDELDFVQAFKDFWQVFIAPIRFFTAQAGRQGFMSPICILAVYLLISMVSGVISSGGQGVLGLIGALIALPFNLVFILCGMMISYLVMALLVHFLGMVFGNRTDYSVSFRAVVYADTPRVLLVALAYIWIMCSLTPVLRGNSIMSQELDKIMNPGYSRNAPSSTGSSSPSSPITAKHNAPTPSNRTTPAGPPTQAQITELVNLVLRRVGVVVLPSIILALVGWAWSTFLLILAVHKMQNISPLAACGVWIIMFTIGLAFTLLILYGCYSLIAAIIGPALHQTAGAGGIQVH